MRMHHKDDLVMHSVWVHQSLTAHPGLLDFSVDDIHLPCCAIGAARRLSLTAAACPRKYAPVSYSWRRTLF